MTVRERVREVSLVVDIDSFNDVLLADSHVAKPGLATAIGREDFNRLSSTREAASQFKGCARCSTILPGGIKIRNHERYSHTSSSIHPAMVLAISVQL